MKLFTMLCCINPLGQPESIDEFVFYQMINPIAPVINIKIFDKKSQVKAFVQVETQELVDKVIKELTGKQLNIGKVKVFLSNKKFIAFDKSVAQIVTEANRRSANGDNIDQSYKTNKCLNNSPYVNNFSTDLRNNFQNYSSWKTKSQVPLIEFYSDKLDNKKRLTSIENDLPFFSINKKKESYYEDNLALKNDQQNELNINIQKMTLNSCLRHLKISNFDMKYVGCQMLFNLFGCFGNIPTLIIHKNLNYAIIEYETEKQAQLVIKYMDCIKFCGRILNVSLYNDSELFDETSKKNRKEFQLYKNKPEDYRFNSESISTVTPPSRILRISCSSVSCSITSLKKLIESIHRPINIIQEQDNSSNHASYLAQFNFLYESFKVLSELHKFEFEGYQLFVNFYKAYNK